VSVQDVLRYGEFPPGFGVAIGTAHAGCAATVAAARDAWCASGDDSAYLRATLDAIAVAERELHAACGDVRARSMTEAAQMIAGPYELRAHERQCRADIAEARRLRARDAVGPVVCERVDAVHAVAQRYIDAARQTYFAGGALRDYLACIHYEQREALRQLDAILADLGDGAWAAADQPRLDAYGHRARHDERERYAAERDDR
jgi:hypothetical protein